MAEKRFTIDETTSDIIICDNGEMTYWADNYDDIRDMVELLNGLNDENEQLKKELEDALLDVKIYKNANATFDNVYQENEKLKSRIEYLERKIERERNATNKQYEKWEREALEKINKLEKENAFLTVEVEALRQIKPIRKLPRELTVLKLDDGDVE